MQNDQKAINQFIKTKGIEKILEECNFNFEIIKSFLNNMQLKSDKKDESKKRVTRRYLTQFKDVYKEMMQNKTS